MSVRVERSHNARMSLTDLVHRRGTAVREFFEANFPPTGFTPLREEWNEQVRRAPIVCAPPSDADANPRTVGTA
jgi:hypothetical protein